jgi:hypothetical protein
MPRIEADIKLDFKDVLIRPKRSTLKSRSQVSSTPTYESKHMQLRRHGIDAALVSRANEQYPSHLTRHDCTAEYAFLRSQSCLFFRLSWKEPIPFAIAD